VETKTISNKNYKDGFEYNALSSFHSVF